MPVPIQISDAVISDVMPGCNLDAKLGFFDAKHANVGDAKARI